MNLVKGILIVSGFYVLAFLFSVEIWLPFQNMFQPAFEDSKALLLFLPHGVRVLSAWLLGWRAIPALFPGVLLVFYYLAGSDAFDAEHIASILIAISVSPAVFYILAKLGRDYRPSTEHPPCWTCIMLVGFLSSCMIATLTGATLGFGLSDIIAYLIGDMAGLFFLMVLMLYGLKLFNTFSDRPFR